MGLFNTTSRAKASFKSKAILNSTIKDNYYSCDKCGGSNLMKHGTSLTCDCDDCGCTRTCSWALQYEYIDGNSVSQETGSITIEPGDTTTTVTLPTAAAAAGSGRLFFKGVDVLGNSPVEITSQSYTGSGVTTVGGTNTAPYTIVGNTVNDIETLIIVSTPAGTYQVVVELETDCGNVNVTFEYTLT
jgi:hypothetical protein